MLRDTHITRWGGERRGMRDEEKDDIKDTIFLSSIAVQAEKELSKWILRQLKTRKTSPKIKCSSTGKSNSILLLLPPHLQQSQLKVTTLIYPLIHETKLIYFLRSLQHIPDPASVRCTTIAIQCFFVLGHHPFNHLHWFLFSVLLPLLNAYPFTAIETVPPLRSRRKFTLSACLSIRWMSSGYRCICCCCCCWLVVS